MDRMIGMDIGGTRVKSVCLTPDGNIRQLSGASLDINDPSWIEAVRDHFETLDGADDGSTAVGVAAPGIAYPDGSAIWWMQGRLAELQNLNWATFLRRSHPVRVLNDAQAALLGETWLGAAAGLKNVVLLTLGTGVGGAAMVDGRLLKGAIGRAGHLGHLSLNPFGSPDITGCPGSLELAIGNATVSDRTGGQFDSTLKLAASNDPAARDAWAISIRSLAAGIVSAINILDPEVIIIGGGIAAAGDRLFQPLAVELDRIEWRPHGHRVKIVPAALGEHAGAIGAARNTLQ